MFVSSNDVRLCKDGSDVTGLDVTSVLGIYAPLLTAKDDATMKTNNVTSARDSIKQPWYRWFTQCEFKTAENAFEKSNCLYKSNIIRDFS